MPEKTYRGNPRIKRMAQPWKDYAIDVNITSALKNLDHPSVVVSYGLYQMGISEIDVTISYKDGTIFVEAKYLALALVSPKATHGSKETR